VCFTCLDLLGSSACSLLPLPDSFSAALSAATAAAAAAAAQPRVDSSSSRSKPAQQPASQPAVMGDLVWTICADGSWAIPIKRGRGRSMAGLRVVWLSKGKRGFVPQVEQGLGNLEPLPGTKGKAMSLQKARVSFCGGSIGCVGCGSGDMGVCPGVMGWGVKQPKGRGFRRGLLGVLSPLTVMQSSVLPPSCLTPAPLCPVQLLAEAWLKSAHPVEAGMRETPLLHSHCCLPSSALQISFC
jgi:hypothetical protein